MVARIIRNRTTKLRFILVGAINTFIDFFLLFFLSGIGISVLVANTCSTATAFAFSFVANKKYTFKSSDGNTKHQIVKFIIVTIAGLWVIQPVIIFSVMTLLSKEVWYSILIAKLIATAGSLVWNYILYSRYVFKSKKEVLL